jgi:hypothetical protein
MFARSFGSIVFVQPATLFKRQPNRFAIIAFEYLRFETTGLFE